ncbi:MAG: PQQ-dependent catabolism-associated beta-propeller protein [Cypionkella sp.]|uniref:PQQ-dependent catabolism-associated beta-propeller protein n=1 Tax=Cypionkella sp. TaxID=2811411 RepID=UPI0027165BB3|nr:PQQ-dependent catabolism-associated beta-propeller protein [Cypionkella sp.]MDO8327382.1 PQQ-dependent catabolism-associated beta-propeller protein [Cypionkella sp.]
MRIIPAVAAAALLAMVVGGPVAAKNTDLIFVSLERGNQVVVLNPDLSVNTRIDTSRRPRDMHFNKDHSLLYVACGDDDSIDVIDVATLAVVDSIPTGPSPEIFAFSPDESQIFVSNEEDSTMEIIDVASKTVVERVATGAEPEGVINSVDGKYVFVTSEVADMVHVIDREKAAVIKNIIVGTRPRRFVVTPDGADLWVSDELSSEVHVIDIASLTIKNAQSFVPPGFRAEDVTPVGMTITKDGSKVLITLGRANHLAIVDAKTYEVLQYVLVGSRAWDVDLTSDEKTAFVANGLSDDITVVDMASMTPVQSLPVGRTPHSIRVDD